MTNQGPTIRIKALWNEKNVKNEMLWSLGQIRVPQDEPDPAGRIRVLWDWSVFIKLRYATSLMHKFC